MGSVKSGEAFYGGVQAGASAVNGADDEYEGSGMAWVKRRRAEKEAWHRVVHVGICGPRAISQIL